MFPLCLKGIRASPVAAAAPGEGLAPRAASPRHLCTHRLRLPHKYSKFLIKTYDCVNSTSWAPNLEKAFHHPAAPTRRTLAVPFSPLHARELGPCCPSAPGPNGNCSHPLPPFRWVRTGSLAPPATPSEQSQAGNALAQGRRGTTLPRQMRARPPCFAGLTKSFLQARG